MAKEKAGKLSVLGLGLGVGIYWGLSMVVIGWTSIAGWGTGFMNILASLYIGYEASFIGGIIGGIWGFVDGLIAGIVVAALYNLFRK